VLVVSATQGLKFGTQCFPLKFNDLFAISSTSHDSVLGIHECSRQFPPTAKSDFSSSQAMRASGIGDLVSQ
jgi:hypothetical protein